MLAFPLPPVFVCWSQTQSMEGAGRAAKTWASDAVPPSFAQFYFLPVACNGLLPTCSSLRPLLSCDISKMQFSSQSASASASPKRKSVVLTRWRWQGFCIYFSVIQSNKDRFDKPAVEHCIFMVCPLLLPYTHLFVVLQTEGYCWHTIRSLPPQLAILQWLPILLIVTTMSSQWLMAF